MIHLTLNTGHTMTVPHAKVRPETIRALAPMVVKRGDLIPHLAPWRTVIRRGDGYASFDIRRGKDMLVAFNLVAWNPATASTAWEELERTYLHTAEALASQGIPLDLEMPEMPATIPWLATWILPTAIANMAKQDFSWLADFEQCLAATIIEKYTAKSQ